MALTGEQKSVLKTILSVANTAPRPVRARIRKAIVETGIVEANLTNPKGGDGTSSGFRQETKSSYPNVDRQNVRQAAKRFVQEASPVAKKYKTAGQLAQAVQRSAYPGRYDQHSKEAQQLVRLYDKRAGKASSGGGSAKVTPATVQKTTTPGVDNSAARQSILQNFVTGGTPGGLLGLAGQLGGAADVPAKSSFEVKPGKVTGGRANKTTPAADSGGVNTHKPLYELFWQGRGGVNVKNGKKVPQGFVSGHTDHVHVASTRGNIVRIGKLAQRMGLHVGENPHFGGVHPVHVQGSYHYKGEAVDVSGDPAKMERFAHTIAKLYGAR